MGEVVGGWGDRIRKSPKRGWKKTKVRAAPSGKQKGLPRAQREERWASPPPPPEAVFVLCVRRLPRG